MSRIGKKLIIIPDNVTVSVVDNTVTVKSGSNELSQIIPNGITVAVKDKQIICTIKTQSREASSLHGLVRSLLANLVAGVTKDFVKTLEIQGTGYRVMPKDKGIELSLGYSHTIVYNPPAGIKLEIKDNKFIVISGPDKHLVGQVAANIRDFRKPDAYKGKGLRYLGEVIKLKPGKAAKAAEA